MFKNNIKSVITFLCTVLSSILASCEYTPGLPIIMFNQGTNTISVVQTDTAAHDMAYLSIDGVYNDSLKIKDTLNITLKDIFNYVNDMDIAYMLSTKDNKLTINLKTTRTNDTTFVFNYDSIDVSPIQIANVTGKCMGFIDVNYDKDYTNDIRLWLYKNKITPNTDIIGKMNSLLRQFNYSGNKEYAIKNSIDIPIINSLQGCTYKINANVKGQYFYLFASNCANTINPFIEEKISNGLKDAYKSSSGSFVCQQEGDIGPNVLYLIGIDENWNSYILPIGVVFVDNEAPWVTSRGYVPDSRYLPIGGGNWGLLSNGEPKEKPWPSQIYFKRHNILVNLPDPPQTLKSTVSISYGSFHGNDYFGYDIPFYINANGDVKTIIIGNHKIPYDRIKENNCITLHLKKLHIGDNSLPIYAIDKRGNVGKSTLNISIESSRPNMSYDEDIEDRINDLEDRISNLE